MGDGRRRGADEQHRHLTQLSFKSGRPSLNQYQKGSLSSSRRPSRKLYSNARVGCYHLSESQKGGTSVPVTPTLIRRRPHLRNPKPLAFF